MGTYDFSSADARTVDNDFQPLPDGEYLMSIDYAEIMETKSGRGEHLKLELVVLERCDLRRAELREHRVLLQVVSEGDGR